MLGKWAKVVLLAATMGVGGLSGLCASAQAITTATDNADNQATPPTRVALLLPLRSGVFGAAADAVRTGFLTASEARQGNVIITIIETGDAVADVLSTYRDVSAKYDIIVGPLSRGAVTALAQSPGMQKPTIALTQPDLPDGADQRAPRQLLMMGLSIEDEARQVAAWTEREKTPGKIFAVSTNIAWQRRAAKAFVQQARQIGLAVESLELSMPNNVLSASGLAQLAQRIQAEKPALLFVALDAAQTIQLRSAVGTDVPLYGTSQLNPLTLARPQGATPGNTTPDNNKLPELDGVHLLDLPWQLQPDHPAVMAYPRSVANSEGRPNADLERLYALGIDAFRVANEIALQRSAFDIDGVTGQINVSMTPEATYFQRRETQAVYQDGVAVPVASQH